MLAKPFYPVFNRRHRLANGLSNAWLFSEGQGDKLYDLVGGNHGTLATSSGMTWTPERGGHAADFTTAGNQFDLSSSIRLNPPFSIGFTCRRRSTSADGMILGFVPPTGTSPNYVWLYAGPNVSIYGNNVQICNKSSVAYSAHYTWLFTYTGSSSTMYRDGLSLGAQSFGSTYLDINCIGDAYAAASTYDFDGTISNVMLWNRVLDAQEAAMLTQDNYAAFRSTKRYFIPSAVGPATAEVSPVTLTWSAPSVAAKRTFQATVDETLPSQTTSGDVTVGSPPVAFGSYPALTATAVDKSLSAVMLSGAQHAPQLLEQFALSIGATPVTSLPATDDPYGLYWNTGTSPGLYFCTGAARYAVKAF